MAIPQSFIDDLVARCPVEEVVADYVSLTPKGGNLWGLCPFHSEKTPSFSVSPDKHIFHCFGCGKGGGVIRFVMEMESLTFPEAVRKLAERAHMEMPEEDREAQRRRQHRQRLLDLNRQAARFYYETLRSPLGEPMRQYIAKRQLTAPFVKRFGLGAAPDGWDHLTKAMTARGFEKGELLEAGLAVAGKNGGVYDKFRNRLMLPVIDASGDFLGFTSRVMADVVTPKYLNTPETPLFKKRSILYGINQAKSTRRNFFLLVEGNLDVITLHQAGFDNAVATMGTALTPEHVRLISRYVKELVLCYDNDSAGLEATQRAMTVLRDTDLSVRVLQLPRRKTPEGQLIKQDPDDFIKYQGAAAFEHLLSGSADQSAYQLSVIQQKHDLNDDRGKAEFLKEAAQMIAQLSSPVEREIYAGRAAQTAGISKESVMFEVAECRKKGVRKQRRQEERAALTPAANIQPKVRQLRYEHPRSARAEEGILRLLFLDPTLLQNCAGLDPERFSVPLFQKLFSMIVVAVATGGAVSPAAFEQELSGEESDLLTQLLHTPASLADAKRALEDYITIINEEFSRRHQDQADPLADLLAVQARRQQKQTMEDGA